MSAGVRPGGRAGSGPSGPAGLAPYTMAPGRSTFGVPGWGELPDEEGEIERLDEDEEGEDDGT